jgi:xylulokinase
LLNSPGNFTAAKLAWVKENEPQIFDKIYKVMLPGDYIAMKLSGAINTTISGLSEGMFWDFKEKKVAKFLLDYFGFSEDSSPTSCLRSAYRAPCRRLLPRNWD